MSGAGFRRMPRASHSPSTASKQPGMRAQMISWTAKSALLDTTATATPAARSAATHSGTPA